MSLAFLTRSSRRLRFALLSALLVLILQPSGADQVVEGRVTTVRDVDTIVVAGAPVRLEGVDGPQTRTRAGWDARAFMNRIAYAETVRCRASVRRFTVWFTNLQNSDRWFCGRFFITARHDLDTGNSVDGLRTVA